MQHLTVLGLLLLVAYAVADNQQYGYATAYGPTYGASYGAGSYGAASYGASYGGPYGASYGGAGYYNTGYNSHNNQQNLNCHDEVAGEYLVTVVQNSTTASYQILVLSEDGDIFIEDSTGSSVVSSFLGTYTCTGPNSVVGTALSWEFAQQALVLTKLTLYVTYDSIQGSLVLNTYALGSDPITAGPYVTPISQTSVYLYGTSVEPEFASELTVVPSNYQYGSATGYGYPTTYPTGYPTTYPTGYPTTYPTTYPTGYPTTYPTGYPTTYPTTGYPTTYATGYPTTYATGYGYPTSSYGYPTASYPSSYGYY